MFNSPIWSQPLGWTENPSRQLRHLLLLLYLLLSPQQLQQTRMSSLNLWRMIQMMKGTMAPTKMHPTLLLGEVTVLIGECHLFGMMMLSRPPLISCALEL